jgi:hypothetical protein
VKVRVTWPFSGHRLVGNARVAVTTDDGTVEPAVSGGQAIVDVGDAVTFVRVQVALRTTTVAHPVFTLTLDQTYDVVSGRLSPRSFLVPSPGAATLREVPGTNPLVRTTPLGSTTTVAVRTWLVDVTGLVPSGTPADLGLNPANVSIPRVLARLDGVVPAFWLTCTSARCRGTSRTNDVLCFLTPPQRAELPADLDAQLGPRVGELVERRAVFLGRGSHAGTPLRAFDHFEPPASGTTLPFMLLSRGWDQAVIDSDRHVVLVLPVPAEKTHQRAETEDLPALLADVFALLVALGDVAPPPGQSLDRPRLGLAGHSFGGASALNALGASPAAYSDVLLFEPTGVGTALGALQRSRASVCLIGFNDETVRLRAALAPKLGSRLRFLPAGYPGDNPAAAPLASILARSPNDVPDANPRSLTHAFKALPSFDESRIEPSIGKSATHRYVMLHQYVVWGGDTAGVTTPAPGGVAESHFLTQALRGSTLR